MQTLGLFFLFNFSRPFAYFAGKSSLLSNLQLGCDRHCYRRRQKENMKLRITILVLAALNLCASAGEIRQGARMQAKENSIWFQTEIDLTVWQRFGKVATAKVLESYQTVVIGSRQAWQFTKSLAVKVLSYDPQENQVKVEMLAPGRLNGSVWWLDGKALGE